MSCLGNKVECLGFFFWGLSRKGRRGFRKGVYLAAAKRLCLFAAATLLAKSWNEQPAVKT